MEDPFRKLARLLDRIPHGFPATPTGVELRILRKIFEPEEASAAAQMLPIPETPTRIGRRIGRNTAETAELLEKMAAKGQIAKVLNKGRVKFAIVPFVIGIYEFQLPRMDAELAALFEEYLPFLAPTLGGTAPSVVRVVPIEARIESRSEILPYDSVRRIIDQAQGFRLMNCVCRAERAALGHPCSHSPETCLVLSPDPTGVDIFPSWGRLITREEAREVLDQAEREGLVHCTYNIRRNPIFICNCCSCCCGLLRGVTEFHAPHLLVRSNFVARVGDGCQTCGNCLKGRCPTAAIVLDGEGVKVVEEKCIGCGVCSLACPNNALTLVSRPAPEQAKPPKNMINWVLARSANRSGILAAAGQIARLGIQALASGRSRKN